MFNGKLQNKVLKIRKNKEDRQKPYWEKYILSHYYSINEKFWRFSYFKFSNSFKQRSCMVVAYVIMHSWILYNIAVDFRFNSGLKFHPWLQKNHLGILFSFEMTFYRTMWYSNRLRQEVLEFILTEGCSSQSSNTGLAFAFLVLW